MDLLNGNKRIMGIYVSLPERGNSEQSRFRKTPVRFFAFQMFYNIYAELIAWYAPKIWLELILSSRPIVILALKMINLILINS